MQLHFLYSKNAQGQFQYKTFLNIKSQEKQKIRWLREHCPSFEEVLSSICNIALNHHDDREIVISINCSDILSSMDFDILQIIPLEEFSFEQMTNELLIIDSNIIQ